MIESGLVWPGGTGHAWIGSGVARWNRTCLDRVRCGPGDDVDANDRLPAQGGRAGRRSVGGYQEVVPSTRTAFTQKASPSRIRLFCSKPAVRASSAVRAASGTGTAETLGGPPIQ